MTLKERRILRIKQFEGWKASGLSQSAYCQRESISYETFRRWRRKLAGSGAVAPLASQFIPVQVANSARVSTSAVHDVCVPPVEVLLGNGRRLRVEGQFDEASLGRLIRLLEALPC